MSEGIKRRELLVGGLAGLVASALADGRLPFIGAPVAVGFAGEGELTPRSLWRADGPPLEGSSARMAISARAGEHADFRHLSLTVEMGRAAHPFHAWALPAFARPGELLAPVQLTVPIDDALPVLVLRTQRPEEPSATEQRFCLRNRGGSSGLPAREGAYVFAIGARRSASFEGWAPPGQTATPARGVVLLTVILQNSPTLSLT